MTHNAPTDGKTPPTAQNTVGARIALARRALQIARLLLLEEASAQGNSAIYAAVHRSCWALDTQALLLTPKTATAHFFDAANDVTPPATEKPHSGKPRAPASLQTATAASA